MGYLNEKMERLLFLAMQMRRYFKHYEQETDKTTLLQLETLMFIQEKPGVSMKEISVQLKISMPATTPLIDRLIATKLVKRMGDKTDRRLIRLELTIQGNARVEERTEQMKLKIKDLFAGLNEEELDTYIKIQTKIIETMFKKKLIDNPS